MGGEKMSVDLLGSHQLQGQVVQVGTPRLADGLDHRLLGGDVRHLVSGERMLRCNAVTQGWKSLGVPEKTTTKSWFVFLEGVALVPFLRYSVTE